MMGEQGMMKDARGFSIAELLVATALTVGVAAIVFSAVAPSTSAFALQTERADLQQRARVVVETLGREIEAAGAGPSTGVHHGPLTRFYAAVLPYRLGAAPDAVTDDAITIVTVPPTHAQSTIAAPLAAGAGVAVVQLDPGCPLASPACGFTAGMTAVVFDGTGAIDVFAVRGGAGTAVTLDHLGPASTRVYPAGSGLAAVQIRTFSRRTDVADVEQLVREADLGGAAIPVADHVVQLAFEYFGDPRPPTMRAGAVPGEPETTYGPSPPPVGTRTTAYPPGENCAFVDLGARLPRLPVLTADAGPLVRLTGAQLADGPWCPDEGHPLRFDADLLRVRRVSIRVRVEAASAAFRGPAGPLFTRGGTATDAARLLPDVEAQFAVAPSNLALVLAP